MLVPHIVSLAGLPHVMRRACDTYRASRVVVHGAGVEQLGICRRVVGSMVSLWQGFCNFVAYGFNKTVRNTLDKEVGQCCTRYCSVLSICLGGGRAVPYVEMGEEVEMTGGGENMAQRSNSVDDDERYDDATTSTCIAPALQVSPVTASSSTDAASIAKPSGDAGDADAHIEKASNEDEDDELEEI